MKKSGWCLRRPIGTPSESAHTLAHTLVWEEYVIVSDKERHLSHNKREIYIYIFKWTRVFIFYI